MPIVDSPWIDRAAPPDAGAMAGAPVTASALTTPVPTGDTLPQDDDVPTAKLAADELDAASTGATTYAVVVGALVAAAALVVVVTVRARRTRTG